MAKKNSKYDVIIAGGGPAGLSALLWCNDLGLDAILIERENETGGQMLLTHNSIKNYLGIDARNGRELRDIFLFQVNKKKMELHTGAEIVEADLANKRVILANGTSYSSRSIIIATGVRRRKLMVPGEDEFRGRGIVKSGVMARNEVSGKTVVIVGGGDAAIENALLLSETAHKIYVVHRSQTFKARNEFVQRARKTNNIELCIDTQITKISGTESVESVESKHLISGVISKVEADAVLIRIGVEANTDLFREQIDLDEAGYVIIDANCSTSLPHVYAVGDVANPVAPTISVAAGHGSAAAKAIFSRIIFR